MHTTQFMKNFITLAISILLGFLLSVVSCQNSKKNTESRSEKKVLIAKNGEATPFDSTLVAPFSTNTLSLKNFKKRLRLYTKNNTIITFGLIKKESKK